MADKIKMSRVIACLTMLIFFASVSLSHALPRDNPPGPRGGPGAGQKKDKDNNPPGPRGGAGTNWENPPGPAGGPGASPDARPVINNSALVSEPAAVPDDNLEEKAIVDKKWEELADTNNDGIVDELEMKRWKDRKQDKDINPPGPAGGPGTDWENPPGPKGGPGASPDRK